MRTLTNFLMMVILLIGCQKEKPTDSTAPTIISISPTSGNANTLVKILGTNFDINPIADTVKFNGIVAKVQSASDSVIIVLVPINGSTGAVSVTTKTGTVTGPVFTYKLVTIYVSGTDMDTAVYWKNGIETRLSGSGSKANCVFISGNDIYIAGKDNNNAVYWKNGTKTILTKSSSFFNEANSILIVGNDVYLAGTDGSYAVYWKNGIEVKLSKSVFGGVAKSIAVSGNDVYVAGYESVYTPIYQGGISVAKYWKNGTSVSLTDSTENAYAFSVAINNGDIYVSGVEPAKGGYGAYAKYWKNNAEVILPRLLNSTSYASATAYAIIISGTDVYAAGYDGYAARYWKNGIGNTLTGNYGLAFVAFPVIAYSIAVLDSDVYLAGSYTNLVGTNTAVYWINGQMTKLTNGNNIATATGIYVK